MKRDKWQYAALVLILVVAAFFRLYGLAWDSGYLFHPDERKIVLVAAGLAWPSDLLTFLSSESPLNPKFFAYGSFPIYLLRALSILAPGFAILLASDRMTMLRPRVVALAALCGLLGASVYLDQLSTRLRDEMAIHEGMIFYSFDAMPRLALEWAEALLSAA